MSKLIEKRNKKMRNYTALIIQYATIISNQVITSIMVNILPFNSLYKKIQILSSAPFEKQVQCPRKVWVRVNQVYRVKSFLHFTSNNFIRFKIITEMNRKIE